MSGDLNGIKFADKRSLISTPNALRKAIDVALKQKLAPHDPDHETYQYIQKQQDQLTDKDLIKYVLDNIKVSANTLELSLQEGGFEALARKKLKVGISEGMIILDTSEPLKVSYYVKTQNRDTKVIKPSSEEQRGIFALDPRDLKKLVQGIAWRDEHFAGKAIIDIANNSDYSETYVGTTIFKAMDMLMAAPASSH